MARDDSKHAFSSFWKRSVDISPSKELVFLPPNETKPRNDRGESGNEKSGLTTKQRRRAQVRKAQTEHRHRKKNYVKHLEQDVINLRKMIAATLTEAASTRNENDRIRKTLRRKNFSTLNLPTTGGGLSELSPITNGGAWPLPNDPLEHTPPWQDEDFDSGTSVTIDFDSDVNASCLHMYHSPPKGPEIMINTPIMFDFPANSFTGGSNVSSHRSNHLKETPEGPDQHSIPLELKVAELGINFILALEHPCRTHFHPISADFNPKGSPTGHELMASTSLYAQAPSYVFATHSDVAWDIPSSPAKELEKLRDMNKSLPKKDSEITPVQAWFLLVERYGMRCLLRGEVGNTEVGGAAQREGGFLEQLRRELSSWVDCFGFGAAMDRLVFWDVVEQVVSTKSRS